MDGKDRARNIVELASWALDRIAKGEYEETRDQNGNIQELDLLEDLYLRGKSVNSEQIEEALKRSLPEDKLDALLELKQHRTRQQLENVLSMLFPPPVVSDGLEELEEAGWPEILLFIDRQLMESPKLAEKILRMVVKEREGFSSSAGREIEKLIENDNTTLLPYYTARTYLAEVGSLLPRVVRRAEILKLLPSKSTIPDKLNRYMVEASRCYIYGQFLATLILCRSAIEEALEDQLKSKGFLADVEAFEKRRSIYELIESARARRVLSKKQGDMAHEVRMQAKDAVHGLRLPTDEECVQEYKKTRFILHVLYE